MKYAPVVFALAFLLSGCDQPLSVASLAADPSRLHTLRAQCRTGAHDAGNFFGQAAGAQVGDAVFGDDVMHMGAGGDDASAWCQQ